MIYVIRHGEVNTNVLEQINGWNEEPLNKKGIKQAIEAGLKLKNIHFDVIYCSPLRRTKQTLEYVNLKDVEVIYDKRIKERNSNSLVKQSIHILDDKIWYDERK